MTKLMVESADADLIGMQALKYLREVPCSQQDWILNAHDKSKVEAC